MILDLQAIDQAGVDVLWGAGQVQSLADLDTAMMNGRSIQRTAECLLFKFGFGHGLMKQMHRLSDGEEFSPTPDVVVASPAVGQPGGQGNLLVN